RWDATTTAHSVTAGGSSGSPIFNKEGLIVGTLTGGNSYCSQTQDGGPDSEDYYGKMSYHWNNSKGAKQMKDYLDPDNTGILKLVGYDPHHAVSGLNNVKTETSEPLVIAFFDQKFDELTINAKDIIDNISIYSLSGKLITRIGDIKSSTTNISSLAWAKGVYNIVVTTDSGIYATKIIK
ncbi:MAG: T9SS type A sorting domain-containing protein, partial [Dysgonomonas sp.]